VSLSPRPAILVTGGSAGIGGQLTVSLARAGHEVYFVGRNEARGLALQQRITAGGDRAVFLQGDLSTQAGVARLAGDLRTALAAPEGTPGLDKDTLGRWLPAFRKPLPKAPRWLIRTVAALAIGAGLVLGTFWGLALVHPAPGPQTLRSGPGGGGLPTAASELIQTGSNFALTLTADEIKAAWAQAQKAFQDYQDSQARFQINRLLLSNAGPGVKEKARALIPYLHDPDFARPEDSSPYQAVNATPVLYEGCTVRWKGVIANLVSGDKTITFDLLLGYQDGQVVEGIVPVELGFAALLKNSQVVEVLGRVVLEGGKWHVKGASLRDLGYRAP